MGEYEVETIVRAKVSKKTRGKVHWQYHVKWKGWGYEDNTWESPRSFEGGSEHFIEQFWKRAGVGGRDINDPDSFSVGEEVFPVGPPRPKIKKTAAKKKNAPSVPASSSTAAPSKPQPDVVTTNLNKRTLPPSLPPEPVEPPVKRRRAIRSPIPVKPPIRADKSTRRSRSEEENGAGSTSAAQGSPSKARANADSRRTNRNSSPADWSDSDATVPASVSDDGSVNATVSASRPPPSPAKTSSSVVDALNQNFSQNTVPETPQFSASEHDEPPVEPKRTSNSRSPAARPTVHPSIDNHANSVSMSPPSTTKATLPAHRARAAQPLVRFEDDPSIAQDRVHPISAKARFLARSGSSGESTSKSANGNTVFSSSQYTSAPKGLPTRKASLLTFQKGTLKTVRAEKLPSSPVSSSNARSGASTSARPSWEVELFGDTPDDDDNDGPAQGTSDDAHEPSEPQPPPTGEQLLQMAGFRNENAETLPDFEDEVPKPGDNEKEATTSVSADTNPQVTGSSSGSAFDALKTAWKESTIFGPLASGSLFSAKASASAPQGSTPSSDRPTLFLSLDPSNSVPVRLLDVHQGLPSESLSMDVVLANSQSSGPPGKIYSDLSVLNALQTGGSSARVVPHSSASQTQNNQFNTFRAQLEQGRLFVQMAGIVVLVFCSSLDKEATQRLGISSALVGLSGCVVVSRVSIRDYSLFADAALQATSVQW